MKSFLHEFYQGKKVLVTGHTGFKGSWLSLWLHKLGAKVVGYALPPAGNEDNFVQAGVSELVMDLRGEISGMVNTEKVFAKHRPEIVFHLAAQPLVRYSFQEPLYTYRVNINGTLNILEAVRKFAETRIAVIVSSDKCYHNREWVWGYRENDPVGGYDPYSASKGCVELIASSYLNSFFNPQKYGQHGKSIATVRAGNVIGGGDWSPDRLVPDCIRALQSKERITLRNSRAVRPWQHVLEPLAGYLLLAAKMSAQGSRYSGAWNFGPSLDNVATVEEMVKRLIHCWGEGDWEAGTEADAPHEATLLNLDISKARLLLGWQPRWHLDKALAKTVAWYKHYHGGAARSICLQQIEEYMSEGDMD